MIIMKFNNFIIYDKIRKSSLAWNYFDLTNLLKSNSMYRVFRRVKFYKRKYT